ncbi:MAG: fused DSP-PTPase phosphatase/NAD kinase-like protein, partial [Anaerolineae bacterium]
MLPSPIPDSYWVVPGKLLAGEYPGAPTVSQAKHRLHQLLGAGITYFLDLTEEGEHDLYPYAALLQGEASALGRTVEHHRMPIPDVSTPTKEQMARILDAIDAALAAGHVVYLHCYGGIGRTGTVVGCYLVRQ